MSPPLLMSLLYVIRMTLQYAFMMVSQVLPFVIMLQTTDCAIRQQESVLMPVGGDLWRFQMKQCDAFL